MKISITELHFQVTQEMKRFEFSQVMEWFRKRYKCRKISQLDRDELENFLHFLREQNKEQQ
jgi:hypothetical protein